MKNNPIEKIRDLLAEPEARRKAGDLRRDSPPRSPSAAPESPSHPTDPSRSTARLRP